MSNTALFIGTIFITLLQNANAEPANPIFACNPSLAGQLDVKVKLHNSKYEDFYTKYGSSIEEDTMSLGLSSMPSKAYISTSLQTGTLIFGNQVSCTYRNGLKFAVTLKCKSASFDPSKPGITSCNTKRNPNCSIYCHKS